ncbi:MAG: hypothetical protein JSW03_08820 [Candidatus Eiseniibacteriota bacterium]|nr:MAG: hypothetical protein JSW03_08820 [Candidatus Eisenbacteria bacterium]
MEQNRAFCPRSVGTVARGLLAALACLLLCFLAVEAGDQGATASFWISSEKAEAGSSGSAGVPIMRLAQTQTQTDNTPPGAVRDMVLVGTSSATHPRGFFIPAHFSLDETAIGLINDRFHLAIVGRDSDYFGIDPDVVILLTGPAVMYSNSMGRADEWETIDSNDDWFLHSSSEMSPDTRIPLSGYPHLFYMNIGAPGWREFVISKYGDVVLANPAVEGVFVDGVPTPEEYASQLGAAFPQYDASAYQETALQFIREIKNAAEGKLVILNSELFRPFTVEADGASAEGFVHFGGRTNDEHLSKSRWLENIEMIADRAFDGHYLLVGSGSLEATLPSMVEYCYASFLLGYNENAHCYFYWHSNAEGGYSTINWFTLWGFDIGEPQGHYSESGGVYKRDFSNGAVIVNPSDYGEPITVSLDGLYLDSAGNLITSVSLPNKTGAVLRKSLWPS